MNRDQLVNLFLSSFKGWLNDNASIRAAALTFFIILPLPSLLLIVVTVFAELYGQSQATQHLIQLISSFAGPVVAELFRDLLASAMSPFTSFWAAITVVGFSLGGAVGTFAVLRDTMNVVWNVKPPKSKNISARVRETIGPFLLVSSLGLIVIVGTVISAALFDAIKLYSINATLTLISLTATQILLSFGLSTLLFAIIYKVLPDRKVHWEDVAFPAVFAGIAFTVVNYVLGWYLQTFRVTTIAGAAGSLLIILLWIYILNQIVLFGAELSKVYATTVGPHPQLHLSKEAEKFFEPFERVGEEIEEAAKGRIAEGTEVKAETASLSEAKPSTVASQDGAQTASNLNVSSVKFGTPPSGKEESEAGSVEVSVVVKTSRKKRKSDEQPG
jgi:membrane protein